MPKTFAPSTWAFAGLAVTLVGIKLLFDNYPGNFPHQSQAAAFTWEIVGGIVLLAFAGLFASRAAGLPDPLSDAARERQALIVAIVTGLAYGVITVASDVADRGRDPSSEWVHMALPWSVPFYTFGTILLEFMLRLGALCVLFWLVHVVLLQRGLRLMAFWTVNLIVALYEIWPHIAEDVASGNWEPAAWGLLGPLYLSNVFQGWLVLRYGWLAPVVFRLSFYAVWHILYGGFAAH